jgi:hypothetical protein
MNVFERLPLGILLVHVAWMGCNPHTKEPESEPASTPDDLDFRCPIRLITPAIPTNSETGGDETDWYFAYTLRGGFVGGTHQVLVVTTNSDLDLSLVPRFVSFHSVHMPRSQEVFVVPEATAHEIDAMLRSRSFFEWNSISTETYDSYQWSIVVKTSSGRHEVFVEEFIVELEKGTQLVSLSAVYLPTSSSPTTSRSIPTSRTRSRRT